MQNGLDSSDARKQFAMIAKSKYFSYHSIMLCHLNCIDHTDYYRHNVTRLLVAQPVRSLNTGGPLYEP